MLEDERKVPSQYEKEIAEYKARGGIVKKCPPRTFTPMDDIQWSWGHKNAKQRKAVAPEPEPKKVVVPKEPKRAKFKREQLERARAFAANLDPLKSAITLAQEHGLDHHTVYRYITILREEGNIKALEHDAGKTLRIGQVNKVTRRLQRALELVPHLDPELELKEIAERLGRSANLVYSQVGILREREHPAALAWDANFQARRDRKHQRLREKISGQP